MKIGVLCAMQKEYDLVCENLYNKHKQSDDIISGTLKENGGHHLVVARSGIGKVNAAITAQKMINNGVLGMFSIGVAGALDENLEVGDIVVGNSYCYHDVWCGEPNKPGQVQGNPPVYPSGFGNYLQSLGDDVRLGTIATGDWFVQTREEAERIREYLPSAYNVLAVDMESAAIAQICYRENIPFTSLRIISDNPLRKGQKEQYDGFWNDMAEKSFKSLMRILA